MSIIVRTKKRFLNSPGLRYDFFHIQSSDVAWLDTFTYGLCTKLCHFVPFSKSSFWNRSYLKNENEKFLFYLKYKENMCSSWFASQFSPPITWSIRQELYFLKWLIPMTIVLSAHHGSKHFCHGATLFPKYFHEMSFGAIYLILFPAVVSSDGHQCIL